MRDSFVTKKNEKSYIYMKHISFKKITSNSYKPYTRLNL